jgi:hypothetical protein
MNTDNNQQEKTEAFSKRLNPYAVTVEAPFRSRCNGLAASLDHAFRPTVHI